MQEEIDLIDESASCLETQPNTDQPVAKTAIRGGIFRRALEIGLTKRYIDLFATPREPNFYIFQVTELAHIACFRAEPTQILFS